jgi:uracil phosphoribosyltransferase
MLKQADKAIVVVSGGDEPKKDTMEEALKNAVDKGLVARQVLLPRDSGMHPRLDETRLPAIPIHLHGVRDELFRRRPLYLIHATDKPANKLLQTPMRDKTVQGAALRKAYHNAGWYLATEYLTLPGILDSEEYEIQHTQANNITKGFRLKDEKRTLIVPLMRGGESMALGVAEAFPSAMFLHAKKGKDITAKHLEKASAVILVDGVVNDGDSVKEFVTAIRELKPEVRIVVVAGFVQQGAVMGDSSVLRKDVARLGKVCLVALRLSANKYTGEGDMDTGARLFNTTGLEKK